MVLSAHTQNVTGDVEGNNEVIELVRPDEETSSLASL